EPVGRGGSHGPAGSAHAGVPAPSAHGSAGAPDRLTPFDAHAAEACPLEEHRLGVRRSDLDRVGHANNTRYVEWGLEATPDEWLRTHALAGLDIVYRREALLGDPLVCRVFPTNGELKLAHQLRLEASLEPLADL